MDIDNDEPSNMVSFDDCVPRLHELVHGLMNPENDEQFKEFAREVCICSRDLEFAVPREGIGAPELRPVIADLSSASNLMRDWNYRNNDPEVTSYLKHVNLRISEFRPVRDR